MNRLQHIAKNHAVQAVVVIALVMISGAISLIAGTEAYKKSKQYKRLEWFSEPRRMPDGSFPTAQMYAIEAQHVQSRKRDADVQDAPDWVELGPVAPDALANGWQGIGRVNCVAISEHDANLMLLGSAHGGIWKSTDAGANWTAVNVPMLPLFGVSDIAFAPSNASVIYAATGDADATSIYSASNAAFSFGVLKSVDAGLTWQPTGLNETSSTTLLVSRLWVDPRDAQIVVAATNIGIQRTTDGGATWKAVTPLRNYRDLIGNPLAPDVLNATTFASEGGAAFHRSTDNGLTWTEVESLPTANRLRLAVTKANANIVLAVASSSATNGLDGVYVSYDKGLNYNSVFVDKNLLGYPPDGSEAGGSGWYDLAAAISPLSDKNFFIGGVNIWRSTNTGAAWFLSAHWQGSGAPWLHADQHYMKFHPTRNVLYACHDGGIGQSTDNGITWKDISKGLKIQQYYALATSNVNPTLTLAGAQDNSTMLTRDGIKFDHVLAADGMDNAIDPVNPDIMYASWQTGNFFRSINGGKEWQYMANKDVVGDADAAWVTPIVTHPTVSGTIYVGYSRVHRSTDFGATWKALSKVSEDGAYRHLAIAQSNPNFIYAAGNYQVSFSTDAGATWNIQSEVSIGYIQDIAVDPSNPRRFWVTYGGYQNTTKIVEVNNGIVKNITGSGLGNVPCNTVRYLQGDPGKLFVGTDLGVFSKLDNSTAWVPYGNGMPTTIVTDMEYIKSTKILRVSTYGRGVWEVPASLCSSAVPAITATPVGGTACEGDTITLEAAPFYSSYRWSNGSPMRVLKITESSQEGDYWVDVEDDAGCSARSRTVTVAFAGTAVRPTIKRTGDTLVATAFGAKTFQWYRDNVAIPGATDKRYLPTNWESAYTVEAYINPACPSFRSNPYQFIAISVEDDRAPNRLVVHPNPAESQIQIQLPVGVGRYLELFDVQGIKVIQQTLDDALTACSLSLDNVSTGTYFLRVRSGESNWMTKVIRR